MTWTIQPRSKRGDLAAITIGKGAPIYLLHGVGLRAEAWGAQIAALSGAHKVIAVDLPGHGDSPCMPPNAQLSDFAVKIASAMDAPALVIGHSFGAMIALELAIHRPDLVAGCVALNAIYRRDPQAMAAVIARADSLDGHHVGDPSQTLARWFGTSPSPQRTACKDWLGSVNPLGYRDAYRAFAKEDGPSDTGLVAIKCPALFITGADEPNSTPEMSQKMAALTPKGTARTIPDAAHMMPMTHAAQVNAALQHFIQVNAL